MIMIKLCWIYLPIGSIIYTFVYNSNSSSWHNQLPTKYQYNICKKKMLPTLCIII